MKMQKSVIFVKQTNKKTKTPTTKKMKINIWKVKNIWKLEIAVIIQGNIEMLGKAYII